MYLALALGVHADILEVRTTLIIAVQTIATSATLAATLATATNTNTDSQPTSTTA